MTIPRDSPGTVSPAPRKDALPKPADELAYTLAVMQAMLESSTDGILATDEEGKITNYNRRYVEMWQTPQALLAEGDSRKLWEFSARQLKNPAQFHWHTKEDEISASEKFDVLELADGRFFERYFETLSIDGRMVGRVWSFRDVTQRYQTDMVSRRLASIVDNSDDAIVGKDLNSIITSWNAGAERIFGYTAKEMIGNSIMKLIPANRQSEEKEILSRIRRGDRIDHFETVRLSKDGRQLHVSITVSPIKDAAGNVVGASKIARDITKWKATEEALKTAKELAERINAEKQDLLESEQAARGEVEKASRMKDNFLATLSHELRTPLSAILGWANILRTGKLEGAAQTQGLETIERNARVQAQIIDDLLDMSRIISGKVRLDVQRLDLSTVLQDAVDTALASSEAKGVRLQAVIDSVRTPVSGDPSRLQQIFWNLMANAIKFTPKGGRVQVLLERVNSHVEVSIIDTGEGIATEFLPLIFNHFQQADSSSTRRYGGLGLGLAIVKQLVELHGGSVRAKSPGLGKGSTFIVSLPLVAVHLDMDSGDRPHHAIPHIHPVLPAIFLSGVRVLVIDDELDARELIKRLLEMAEATVSLAESAEKALEQIHSNDFDVIICDIGMPLEDGYSLMRRIRSLKEKDKSEIPAVALTAYARAEDRTKAIREGFQNHLTKPVEPGELLAVVQSLATPRSRFESAAKSDG